jgi:hypothetical protein
MPHFKSSIRTAQGSFNFYFNRVHTAFGIRYHLSTIGRNGKAIIFYMEENRGKWMIVRNDDTPAWIIDIEEQLSQKITRTYITELCGR